VDHVQQLIGHVKVEIAVRIEIKFKVRDKVKDSSWVKLMPGQDQV